MTINKEAVSYRNLIYPVFLIENKKGNELTGYSVVESQSDFVPLGRVPAAGKYHDGLLFDSAGYIYEYSGSRGWPLFRSWSRTVLEATVIPSILTKLLEFLVYFGPNLKSRRKVNLEEFKETIIDAISRFEDHEVDQLESILSGKYDYLSAIKSVDWFRYFGGQRDELGMLA